MRSTALGTPRRRKPLLGPVLICSTDQTKQPSTPSSTMSRAFLGLVIYQPPPSPINNTDPLEYIDQLISEGVASGTPLTTKKLTTACHKINWLPKELTDIIDAHRRTDNDVDETGKVDREKLTATANKLFDTVKQSKIGFVNFYQFKQFALRFADHWGFHLVTTNNFQMQCFYAETTTKKHQTVVSPTTRRRLDRSGCFGSSQSGPASRAAVHSASDLHPTRSLLPVLVIASQSGLQM